MKFLKKRWHSIPIGIITAILLVCLLGGGVFAAYDFWSATADVTVTEPMEVVLAGSGPGEIVWNEDNMTVTASLAAGSSTRIGWTVTNTNTGGPLGGALTVMPTVSPESAGGVVPYWQVSSLPSGQTTWSDVVAGSEIKPGEALGFRLVIWAPGDAEPNNGAPYTFTIAFNRS